jgi:hypothetical protein
MPTHRYALAAAFAVVLSATIPAAAGPQVPRSVADRTRTSERVVVATVTKLQSRYETNRFGDRLIVSTATLAVDEVMKGEAAGAVELDIEGGTVGEITLRVSDLPALEPGQRAVFFLARGSNGAFVPHLRGQSIVGLDRQSRVRGTDVSLDDVRRQVHAAR